MPLIKLADVDTTLQRVRGCCNVIVNMFLGLQIENKNPQSAIEMFCKHMKDQEVQEALVVSQNLMGLRSREANRNYLSLNESNSTAEERDNAFVAIARSHRDDMLEIPLFEQLNHPVGELLKWLGIEFGENSGYAYFFGLNEIEHAIGVVKYPGGYIYFDPNDGAIYGAESKNDIVGCLERVLGPQNRISNGMVAIYRI